MFEFKHIRAVLQDAALRKLLLDNESLPLEKYINFDQQCREIQDEIVENIDEILQAHAPFQSHYSSPVQQLPDDAWIYGTRGVYVVRNQDGCILFTRKVAAVRYADEMSEVSWNIARDEGLVEP